EPTLFIDKYKRFAQEENNGQRIDLASNFRSREHVLTGTNYIFRQILDEELGEIKYDTDAELIYANKMYDAVEHDELLHELLINDLEAEEGIPVYDEEEN